MSGVWLTDLADILRAAGVPVEEMTYKRGPYAGRHWTKVGANGRGLSDFQFVMWHHDASKPGPSYGALEWVMYSDVAPAASIWVDMKGTWFIYCAGLAWHAGRGGPGWGVPQDAMNSYALGIETDHTTGEPWPPAQLESLRRGTAAIMAAYGIDPQPGLLFHRTWTDGGIDGVPVLPTRGRKNDPDGLDLVTERQIVARLIAGDDKEIARLKKRRRSWLRRRDQIKDSGKTAGLPTARRRIRELTARIRALGGK